MKLAFTFGTRPEGIKLAPLIRAAQERDGIEAVTICTGQHRELLRPVLDLFGIQPDHDLDLMTEAQTLASLTAAAVRALDGILGAHHPAVVVVQGDTTTAFCAALAAFYHKIPVAHVEAGLRTADRYSPFPEEINRRLITPLAHWHLAPTPRAKEALLAEGVVSGLGGRISVTGNTGIDALLLGLELARAGGGADPEGILARIAEEPGRTVILVTGHRRESFGEPLQRICAALRRIAEGHPEVLLVYPVHLNPNVRGPVEHELGGLKNVLLAPPAGYAGFLQLLGRARFVVTDSGGVQEEAPALGKPVLVTRATTERPEAVEAGSVILCGPDEQRIVAEAERLLADEEHYRAMAVPRFPYGDGKASGRCLDAILGLPVEEFVPR